METGYALAGDEAHRPISAALPVTPVTRGPIFFASQWRERAVALGLSDPIPVPRLNWWPWMDTATALPGRVASAVVAIPPEARQRARLAWRVLRHGVSVVGDREWWDDDGWDDD